MNVKNGDILTLDNGGYSYQPTLELCNLNTDVIKDNLQDIDPKDVKMFSLQDIQDAWFDCYNESFKDDYEGIYNNLKLKVK